MGFSTCMSTCSCTYQLWCTLIGVNGDGYEVVHRVRPLQERNLRDSLDAVISRSLRTCLGIFERNEKPVEVVLLRGYDFDALDASDDPMQFVLSNEVHPGNGWVGRVSFFDMLGRGEEVTCNILNAFVPCQR